MFSFSVCFQIQQKNAHVTRDLVSVMGAEIPRGEKVSGTRWVLLFYVFYWRNTCACDICVYRGEKKNKQ